MKFKVTILQEKFYIEEVSYYRAKASAAKVFNERKSKKKERVYPIGFLINLARAEKVDKSPLGRKRKYTDDLVEELGGEVPEGSTKGPSGKVVLHKSKSVTKASEGS